MARSPLGVADLWEDHSSAEADRRHHKAAGEGMKRTEVEGLMPAEVEPRYHGREQPWSPP